MTSFELDIPENAGKMRDPAAEAEELVVPIFSTWNDSSLEERVCSLQELQLQIAKATHEIIRERICFYLIKQVGPVEPALSDLLMETLAHCGRLSVLSAAIAVLKDTTGLQTESFRTSVLVLKHALFKSHLWKETDTAVGGEQAMDERIQFILLMPQQIANACRCLKHPLPSWSVLSRFIPRLVQTAVQEYSSGDSSAA